MNPRLDVTEPQDSGLMSQSLLQQFADLLHMDIAIHHRELTGRVTQRSRKSVVEGKRVDLGGRRIIKNRRRTIVQQQSSDTH